MDIGVSDDCGGGESESELQTPHSSSSSLKAPQFINLNEHKAGLGGLDKERINRIIQEVSKGSPFYLYQQKRQKRIEHQIKQYQEKLKLITEAQLKNYASKANSIVDEFESRRTLNRILVHFDMDMFFAAVEIKKNPSLADKPVAVGTMAMISTSNYVARRYGVCINSIHYLTIINDST